MKRLAEEFGISLLPVAEALKRLEIDLLVESRPRAETRVRIPAPDEVRGRCIVREALEAQSARLCCAQITMKERLAASSPISRRFPGPDITGLLQQPTKPSTI